MSVIILQGCLHHAEVFTTYAGDLEKDKDIV